ncbi:diacylglycerol kinase family protein [Fictibacillus sp. Mic-4]|uniref:diacylglycerol/lipid kinase family protein n=1 Tax=Fictibacillus sp. Mic-4 TaxID=3132826 RepID=UPI003CF30890
MKKAAIILNPTAGNRKLANSIDVIKERLLEGFDQVVIHETKEKGDGAKIVSLLAEEVDLLIGAGGDGTIYEIVNALCPLKKRPAFAIIPGGTCNDFSRTIGMNQDPLIAVEQILEKKTEQVDVGKCDKQYFLNFWGIGLISEVSANIETDNKQRLGKLSYYISAGKTVFQSESFHLKVKSDSVSYDDDAVMLLIGNGAFLGGFRAFFPESDIQDGLFDVLIVKEASLQHVWTWLQSKVRNQFPDGENDGLVYFHAKKLEIEASPVQEIDCDGERNYCTPSRISVLPAHLTVLVGDYPFINR